MCNPFLSLENRKCLTETCPLLEVVSRVVSKGLGEFGSTIRFHDRNKNHHGSTDPRTDQVDQVYDPG